MPRTRAIVLLAAMAATACTGSPGPVASPTPSTSAPRPPTSATPSPDPSQTRRPLARPVFQEYDLPEGTRPHDVAPGIDGRIWYTGQGSEELGLLNPANGNVRRIDLGSGARPHGVIVGPRGHAWVTEGGRSQIVRVRHDTFSIRRFRLPGANANLNTAAFDADGILWFTGQNGIYGRVNPRTGNVRVFDAPRGLGPYGISATPDGTVWYSSLAGSYIARITGRDGGLDVVDVPTPGGGGRRVWSDSLGRLYVTEWFAGKLARYNPANGAWREWNMPGAAEPYAVYVDDADVVWITDFNANALVRFDPVRERFATFEFPSAGADVRQLLGTPGEVWGAESGTDKLVVARIG